MTQRQNIAAVIPLDLLDEDDLLHRFGRWAMTRDARRRCGSAERYYRPLKDTTNTNEDDRAPRELLMGTEAAMAVQRALAQVPAKWREVIEVLYVPQRIGQKTIPPEAILRKLRIPPRLSQERHIEGLRMFRNLYRKGLAKSNQSDIIPIPGAAPETTSSPLAGSAVSETEARTPRVLFFVERW
jgi:hypothetical protein